MGSIPAEPSYLVVGAGCFGASTALHLSLRHPQSKIVLVDRGSFPNQTAAAHDVNKIIRADYRDMTYMKLGLEAQDSWRHDPIFSPWYHETGMMFVEDFGMGAGVLENYKGLLGTDGCPATIIPSKEAHAKFPMFQGANWDGVDTNFWNPRSGYGDADKALTSIITAAVENGVQYVADGVAHINLDHGNATKSVTTLAGDIIQADCVILCTGAHTAKLLADSAPQVKNLQVKDRMVAAAAVTCYATVPEDRRHLFQGAPVVFNGLSHTHGESVPIDAHGRLKFNFELSFTNKQPHEASGQMISVPPDRLTQSIWSQDVPDRYKREVRTAMKHIYGDLVDDIEPDQYRMCWDAVTPTQDWIISPHPHSAGLYIAGGGSFHAWKFLPIIGKYIVQMLEGTLDEDLAQRWAWDRHTGEGDDNGEKDSTTTVCHMYTPGRDLNDEMDV